MWFLYWVFIRCILCWAWEFADVLYDVQHKIPYHSSHTSIFTSRFRGMTLTFNHNFHASCYALHQSFTLIFTPGWPGTNSSDLFDGFWPSSLLLITILEVHVWRLGLPILLHPHLDWPVRVTWSIAGVREHCQSKAKRVFFRNNLVHGLIHVSLTNRNQPHSSLAEAPPHPHQSSTSGHCGVQASPGSLCMKWKEKIC